MTVAALAGALVGAGELAQSGTHDAVEVAVGSGGSARDADARSGEVRLQLEDVPGFFTEGFEIGIRFETSEGELIASTLWSDFVASTGGTDIDSYYDAVLSQSVPAGIVRVSAEVNVGAGPGPSIPDLSGDLRCLLIVEVDSDASVTVEVSFVDSADCLHVVPSVGTADSTTTALAPVVSPGPTATFAPAAETIPKEPSFEVGTSHYVDVDLECQAFELGGVWVLVEGDTSRWQPVGERHEGGTFTIDRVGYGRFVGDANGEKTATFRLLPADESPACSPVPRGSR